MAGLLVFCIIYYLLAGAAISLGYHRMLSHRAVRLPLFLERFLVTLGLPAGTPIQWAGNHRFHHANTDVPDDPHSPNIDGFWYAHVGWYIQTANPVLCLLYSLAGPLRLVFDGIWRPRSNQQYNYLAQDVAKDSYYRWISRPLPYMLALWLHGAITIGLGYYLAGWTGVAVIWTLMIFILNSCDAIDSIAHLFGARPYKSQHMAGNTKLLAWITQGEGWHANHHSFPTSAKIGLFPGQFDWTWQIIRFLEKTGLAKEITLPSQEQIKAKLIDA